MRVRIDLLAVVVAAGLLLCGCGETKKAAPPGADTDTPTVNIDEGAIDAPGDTASEGETAKKKADQ